MPETINSKNTDSFFYNNLINPLSQKLCFINPNIITFINILLIVPLSLNLTKNVKIFYFIIIVLVNRLLDLLDGSIARNCNRKTKFGAFLDIFCDFLFVFMGLIIYLYYINKSNTNKNIKVISTILVSIIILILIYLIIIELVSTSWSKKISYNNTIFDKIIIFYL